MFVSVHEVASNLVLANEATLAVHKWTPHTKFQRLTDRVGQISRKQMAANKLYKLTPEEILGLTIERQSILPDNTSDGFQRLDKPRTISKYACDMRDGDLFPNGTLAIIRDDAGNITGYSVVDSQQRSVAAVLAGLPFSYVTREMTLAERKRFYDMQGEVARITEDERVFGMTGPVYDFLRAARKDPAHPWAALLDRNLNGSQSLWVLAAWASRRVVNSKHQNVRAVFGHKLIESGLQGVFTPALGAELATILKTWGYGPKSVSLGSYQVKATTSVAIRALLKNPTLNKTQAQAHWNNQMPSFEWDKAMAEYRSISGRNDSRALEIPLVEWWNSGLKYDGSNGRLDG